MELKSFTNEDKAKLLIMLWKNSRALGLSFLSEHEPTFEEAEKVVTSPYVDYFCGRVIKINFNNDTLNGRNYDRDNGEGACERVYKSFVAFAKGDKNE